MENKIEMILKKVKLIKKKVYETIKTFLLLLIFVVYFRERYCSFYKLFYFKLFTEMNQYLQVYTLDQLLVFIATV